MKEGIPIGVLLIVAFSIVMAIIDAGGPLRLWESMRSPSDLNDRND